MSVQIELRCACGAVERPRAWFKLTKNGVLRLEGGSNRWHVDGGGATCPRCVTEEQRGHAAQRESWAEYDRRPVEFVGELDL